SSNRTRKRRSMGLLLSAAPVRRKNLIPQWLTIDQGEGHSGSNEVQVKNLNHEKERLLEERRTASQRLGEIQRLQTDRQQAVMAGSLPGQLVSVDGEQVQTATQIAELQREQQDLASQAQRERAHAKRLRTLAQLQREFTGLDVTICPCCSKAIDTSLIAR